MDWTREWNPARTLLERTSDAYLRSVIETHLGRYESVGDTLRVWPEGAALAPLIDHTILKPEAAPADIARICGEALEYGFATVCVNPVFVTQAARLLEGSPTRVCTVAGFPLGASAASVKAFETEQAVRDGAAEVDMVLAVGLLKAGQWQRVRDDIRAVVEAADGAAVKVILETCLLTPEEKVIASVLCAHAEAAFVKTSTGFSAAGADALDVALMRRTVGRAVGVKAAGGIRTLSDAERMIEHGASRIGASASPSIVQHQRMS